MEKRLRKTARFKKYKEALPSMYYKHLKEAGTKVFLSDENPN
ncbi:hypothetical protein [Halobacillus hunanensis]|nr:hypothetical protein [Halobacillus hunanensis]